MAEIHTVPQGSVWINERAGEQFGPRWVRKADAVRAGRERAIEEKTEHVIHNGDGTIAAKNSYGHDPNPPKG